MNAVAAPAPTAPLSNLQLTLLNLYAQNVSEEDLKAIHRLMVQYFAQKASAAADLDWVEKGYTEAYFKKAHLRTPYKSNQTQPSNFVQPQ